MEDLAEAHLKALDYLADGGESSILNCGYGHGYSVREVLEMVRKVSGKHFEIKKSAGEQGTRLPVSDNRAIKEQLGGSQHDDLEIICSTAFQWERAGEDSAQNLEKRNRKR